MTGRTQPHDRRIHADALRRQHRSNQWSRFKRQAGIMLATVALGAVAVPYVMLDQDRKDAIAAYSVARAKLWLASGTFADAEVSIRIGGQTYPTALGAGLRHLHSEQRPHCNFEEDCRHGDGSRRRYPSAETSLRSAGQRPKAFRPPHLLSGTPSEGKRR